MKVLVCGGRGTKHMKLISRKAGVEVQEID